MLTHSPPRAPVDAAAEAPGEEVTHEQAKEKKTLWPFVVHEDI